MFEGAKGPLDQFSMSTEEIEEIRSIEQRLSKWLLNEEEEIVLAVLAAGVDMRNVRVGHWRGQTGVMIGHHTEWIWDGRI